MVKLHHKILPFILLFSFISPIFVSAENTEIVVGPYLQSVDEEGITIMWRTNVKTEENTVFWGKTMELENEIAGESNVEWHEVRIEGLEPSTHYFYKVKSDGAESKIYSFYIPPTDNFTFLVYGDTRGVWDGWRNASIVAKAIEKENASIVIHAGDIVRNGGNEEQWLKFFQVSPWMHNKSMYPAVGNHDLPIYNFALFFSLPGNERWYSFDYGSIHFTFLDSNRLQNLSQFLWLIKDISTESKWKVVIFHHPPLISGNYYPPPMIKIWMLIFYLAGVDVVFAGHQHYYQHLKAGNMHCIITGGGGAPPEDAGRSPWNIFSASAFHYCKVMVTEEEMRIVSIDVEGDVLEDFVIS